jgi:transposase
MIRPSFIPSRAIRDLRDFTRRRKQMIGAAAQERNRVQKILEDANVKIGDVLTDVFGLSRQLMLEALVKGLEGKGSRQLSTSRNWPAATRGRNWMS